MRRAFIVAHTTALILLERILKQGLRGGRGGHDRAGAGVYFSVLTQRCLELLQAGKPYNAAAIMESRRHGARKYDDQIVTLLYEYDGQNLLDLSDPELHRLFVAFSNAIRERLEKFGYRDADDQDWFRPRLHLSVRAFCLMTAHYAQMPIDAVIGRFPDPLAPVRKGAKAKNSISPRVPEELCVLNTNRLKRLGDIKDAKREWGDVVRPGLLSDYRAGARKAVAAVSSMSGDNFAALLRSALVSGDQASALIAPPPQEIELIYSSQFVEQNDSHRQILELQVEAIAKEVGATRRTVHVDATFGREQERKWTRNIVKSKPAIVIALDGNQTVAGMARNASDIGAPCLLVTRGEIDVALQGRSDLVVLQIPFEQPVNASTRTSLQQAVSGFLNPDWREKDVEDALSNEDWKLAARLEGVPELDRKPISEAIAALKRAHGEPIIAKPSLLKQGDLFE